MAHRAPGEAPARVDAPPCRFSAPTQTAVVRRVRRGEAMAWFSWAWSSEANAPCPGTRPRPQSTARNTGRRPQGHGAAQRVEGPLGGRTPWGAREIAPRRQTRAPSRGPRSGWAHPWRLGPGARSTLDPHCRSPGAARRQPGPQGPCPDAAETAAARHVARLEGKCSSHAIGRRGAMVPQRPCRFVKRLWRHSRNTPPAS